MEMTSSQEMTIPKLRGNVIVLFVINIIVVLSICLAVVNIFNRVAMIASFIWLAFITMILWTPVKKAGSFHRFLTDCNSGALFGRDFTDGESLRFTNFSADERNPLRIRVIRSQIHSIRSYLAIDKIESVEWSTGQATGMAGRDMNDWSVHLWLDRGDPVNKPNQRIYTVGPARRRKEITELFGLSFVTFLRAAGAQLIQGEISNCFVRNETEMK